MAELQRSGESEILRFSFICEFECLHYLISIAKIILILILPVALVDVDGDADDDEGGDCYDV